jgi:serine/threonine protein kinase
MGMVYEVFDRERGHAVALKTLVHFDPAGLYQFKKEFRILADVQHTNLVRLYELVINEVGETFFTMELVRGKEFTQYTQSVAGSSANAREHGPIRRATAADVSRLRPALQQLAAGVSALHAAGRLHRDIKPANALVTEEGRVVLLDFGMATELATRGQEADGELGAMLGTAQYMAPEQVDEGPGIPASDWYSVGVILYEALVGTPPFVGTVIDVLTKKQFLAAPLPSASVDGVPPDLDALCHDLLEAEPNNRPAGGEILRRLGVARNPSTAPLAMPKARSVDIDAALIGREDSLRSLVEAFEATRKGRTVTVFVTGPSGIGKTRLIHHFLDELVTGQQAVVLRGRAYEREAVPYKAFDAVMDSLSGHLMSRREAGEDLALPADFWLLGRLFPVFQRISAHDEGPDGPVDEPQTVRRRAFSALRELLGSLSQRSPVVIFVDDVHWGDADSAALLVELVRPPSAGRLLVLMTYQKAKEASPFLNETKRRWPVQADQRRVIVDALDPEDSRRLALTLLDENDEQAQRSAREVARESLGQPFLIEELVRANRDRATSPSTRTLAVLSVEQMIGERLGRLSDSARRLAEVVAVGGQPLPISVAIRAAGVDPNETDELVAEVCGRRFARAGLRDGRDVLESTHDRIRERVVAQLPEPELRRLHTSLAQALEDAPARDGEAIAEHWLGAGDVQRAAAMAREAGEQAIAKFAFDQGVRLLRIVLQHAPGSSPEVHAVRVRLAWALQLGGRSAEAGEEYLRAVATAPPEQRLELQRSAAEQFLSAGRMVEGERILHQVLARCGMRAPGSQRAALFWLIVYSVWIWVRGYKFKEREPADVSEQDRMRVEALYTAGIGFGFVNSILSICLQKRQWIEAQRVGDRAQVLVALAISINHMNAKPRESEQERALVGIARDLARRTDPAKLEPLVDAAVGLNLFFRGQWLGARDVLKRAEEKLRHSGNRVEAVNTRIFHDWTYGHTGDFAEYSRRNALHLAEADDRGDLYTIAMLRSMAGTREALVSGETEDARKMVRDAMAQWPEKFSVQHFVALTFVADLGIYEGRGGAEYDTVVRTVPALKRSLLLGVWYIRTYYLLTRGRLAIASIPSHPELRGARIAEARKMARLLAREPNAWALFLGSFVKSAAELASSDREAAVAELRRTIELCAAADSHGLGIAARYRLGEILDDDDGRTLVREATETMQAWGVADARRYVYTMLPGEFEDARKSDPAKG